ncbi:poly ADP-ribose polymerase 3-like [Achlya hypogyna]|uniref:Poly [ADP-ribose] polymerase n=1 Tax=Achlya hypogyna TaxID=1202772 RepID=A0A1V9YFR0_ACHHY|nr:poly ADP-ribose polymerase 3-like [Achlya hypogyna]
MAVKRTADTTPIDTAPTKRATRSTTKTSSAPAAQVAKAKAASKPKASKAKNSKVKTTEPVTAPAAAAPTIDETTPAAAASFQRKVDDHLRNSCYHNGATVVGDYDVMLNQVEIKATTSKNKFYRLQLLAYPTGQHDVWTRWGRVGEAGDSMLLAKGATWDLATATAAFEKKFKDKTKNAWGVPFVPKKGSYEIVELDAAACAVDAPVVLETGPTAPSALPGPTQELLRMIFDKDMFRSALTAMELDPARMPLGTLSAAQIAKGVAILDSLQAGTGDKQELSAKFYQLIPHAFGRSTIPPVLATPEQIEAKYAMLATLHDIVVAQDVQKASAATALVAHPIDRDYAQLQADLDLVDPTSDTYATLTEYIRATSGNGLCGLRDIWAVRRSGEDASFAAFDAVDNHRLLWHGTNVAVVAAILKSGLRIMPSSGGRVGKGIYLANMLQKSRQYVCAARYKGETIGCVFLVEAALGRMHEITSDDSSITKAPTGSDSVLAKGRIHPDAAHDRHLNLDGRDVTVNCGPQVSSGVQSSFQHDEYLVYQEAQQRLRYILTFKL